MAYRTNLEITPTYLSEEQKPPRWSNVADWSNLSQVHPAAAAASAYSLPLWPNGLSLANNVQCHMMLASPGYARLASFHTPYDLTTTPPTNLGTQWDRDWGFEWGFSSGTNNLTYDVTNKWNAIVNADPNWQHQIMVEVKGTGILYMARLEISYVNPA